MQYLTGGDIAQLQVDEETARRRQQQAQQLIQAGYSPVQGGNPLLAMLASVMSTVKGNSMLKDSDAKLSETLAKRFEYENQQSQAKAEADLAANAIFALPASPYKDSLLELPLFAVARSF